MPPFYNQASHLARVTNQGFDVSKERKTPFFFLEFLPIAEVAEGQQYAVEGKYSRLLKFYITRKTVARVRKQLGELGWTGENFRELEPSDAGHHSFVGTEFIVECTHSDGYEEWQLPYEPAPSQPKESNAAIGRKLDALFGKSGGQPAAAAKPSKPAPVKKPESVGATAAKDEQEIPF